MKKLNMSTHDHRHAACQQQYQIEPESFQMQVQYSFHWTSFHRKRLNRNTTLTGSMKVRAYLALLCFALLHFTDRTLFTSWRFVATFLQARLSVPFFLEVFAHFMSLCYILVILTIFQTFSLLLYFLWWPVIGDLWCYAYNHIRQRT